MKNSFGWELPAGCTYRDIDEAEGDISTRPVFVAVECPLCGDWHEIKVNAYMEGQIEVYENEDSGEFVPNPDLLPEYTKICKDCER